MVKNKTRRSKSPEPTEQADFRLDSQKTSLTNPFAVGNSSVRNRIRPRPIRLPLNETAGNSQISVEGESISRSVEHINLSRIQRPLIDQDHHHRSCFEEPVRHYLEMEASPGKQNNTFQAIPFDDDEADLLNLGQEPLKTTSGLQLTHRKMPNSTASGLRSHEIRQRTSQIFGTLEMDFGMSAYPDPYAPREASHTMRKIRRMLSLAQCWIVAFALILLIGTGVIIRHSRYSDGPSGSWERKEEAQLDEMNLSIVSTGSSTQEETVPERIILRPLHNVTQLTTMQQPRMNLKAPEKDSIRRALRRLRDEFEQWVDKHEKKYYSDEEKNKRFEIWAENHQRTIEKNERHGPCKLTKKPVFGSNHFKDLTPEEFQKKYLTGYNGPRTDQLQGRHRQTRQSPGTYGMVFDPSRRKGPVDSVHRHPTVQTRYVEHWKQNLAPKTRKAAKMDIASNSKHRKLGRMFGSSSYSGSCNWYDVSCWLRWIVNAYGYNIGGTMEPDYDADSYPSAIDWRDLGAVTDIHSQGSCGACWAITAVETIESAYYLSTSNLVDLSETEVIVCDDTCEMCNGGWPQNAYEYAMENNGLPLEESISYDGDFLLAMTYATEGEGDELNEDYVDEYKQAICPNGGGGHSGSQDSNSNSYARYGKIKGYGYATDRCVCYTDGTGCDCDEQNEKLAVMNVATYGPATVCLEASVWQDYEGGIMTAEIGCSSAFLDMNHCVQVVGYAYTDVDDEDGEGNQGSNSHSGSHDSNDGKREGYWIVRNQWSKYWGMNGYAYVAMGDNTCGVLNDMTQAYM